MSVKHKHDPRRASGRGDKPPHRIVISSSSQVRLEAAMEYLKAAAKAGEVLLLAPTRGAADDFARAYGSRFEAMRGVYRSTFTGLVANLATEELARQNLAPITGLGTEALAARSIHACRATLAYFGKVADAPGFPGALAATLSELRMEAIDRRELANSGVAGADLALLLECYEKDLASRSLADYATMCSLAAEVATNSSHRLLGLPLLMLDVVPESQGEEKVLSSLAVRANSVFATVLAEDEEGIHKLKALFGVDADRLDRGPAGNSLERLRQSVFSTSIPEKHTLDDSVEFFSAPGEGLECLEIVRRIRRLAQISAGETSKQPLPFDRTAILLRHPDAYLPLVEDALRRAGIEGYFTRGVIRPDPSGRAFLALLACAEEDLTASRFAEYLSLGQVPPVTASGAPPEPPRAVPYVPPEDELQLSFRFAPQEPTTAVTGARGVSRAHGVSNAINSDPGKPGEVTPVSDHAITDTGSRSSLTQSPSDRELDNNESPVVAGTLRTPFDWEKLLVDAAVIGGKDRWSRRLRGLENEFALKLKQAEAEGGSDSERGYLLRQLETLKHLENFALPVIEFLGGLPRRALWGEWLTALSRLAGIALRQPTSVLSVLAELTPMEEVGPVTLAEVRQVLNERLSFLRREPPLRRYGRVFVGSIQEAQGRSFEAVFVPGLGEGVFPRRAVEDPLLLDGYRKKLSPELETREKRAGREKLLLRQAASAARSCLCVSYSRMDVSQSRPRVPSVFILEVLRAAEGRLPPLNELERRGMDASQARLGWPAPSQPKDALDDAEYDLAVLEPLLNRAAAEVKGHGAYLVESSPILARALRTRWGRWNWKWSGMDGLYNPDPATLAVLAKHRMNVRSYSPSALQNYSMCPYRFFLQAIHRLREREDALAIERLDPLTRGGLFHEVQFKLFRALQEYRLLPVTTQNYEQVMDLADAVYDAIVGEWQEELAPAIPQVWRSEIEDLRTDLRGWVLQLRSIHADWVPVHFEYAFGLPPGPAREAERDRESRADAVIVLDGVKIRGSIDLIEKSATSDVLRVTDHKTGRTPWPKPRYVGHGEILQPLLYSLAAEKMLPKQVKSGVLFYCTQRGSYSSVEIPLDQEGRKWIQQVMRTIDVAIQQGTLPAAPRKDACRICDYAMVCGPNEEMRVRQKKTRLEALEDLRCLP